MDKEIIMFDDTEIEKYKFYRHKRPILIHDIDINETVVSNKVSFDKKNLNTLLAIRMLQN